MCIRDSFTWDAITSPTPLDALRTDLALGMTMGEAHANAMFSTFGGKGWEWINLATLAGGTSASRRCLIHACSLLAIRSRVTLATSASTAVRTAAMIARVSAGLTGMAIDARNRVAIDERHGQVPVSYTHLTLPT